MKNQATFIAFWFFFDLLSLGNSVFMIRFGDFDFLVLIIIMILISFPTKNLPKNLMWINELLYHLIISEIFSDIFLLNVDRAAVNPTIP
jgi:hypothetical protein